MTDDNVEYKRIVEAIQADVGTFNALPKEKNKDTFNLYPMALPTTLSSDTGIIVDDQYSVDDLDRINKINPPMNLHWLQIKTYATLEQFLKDKGIPAYISFDGRLSDNHKDKNGYDCARLFITACKEKGLKELPMHDCHCPITTMKQKIDLLLLDYKPNKKYSK